MIKQQKLFLLLCLVVKVESERVVFVWITFKNVVSMRSRIHSTITCLSSFFFDFSLRRKVTILFCISKSYQLSLWFIIVLTYTSFHRLILKIQMFDKRLAFIFISICECMTTTIAYGINICCCFHQFTSRARNHNVLSIQSQDKLPPQPKRPVRLSRRSGRS